MDDPAFRSTSWEDSGYGRWSEVLGGGEILQSAVADLPPMERPALESHGVVSLSEFPVFVGGEWWGVIGFDDCEGVREWSSDELSALRASATVLGAAVQRRRLDEVVMDTEVRSRQLIEHIPAVVYIESPEGDPERFYISPQVEAIFGYAPDVWRWTPDFWLDRIHPDDRAGVEREDEHSNAERTPFSLEYRFLAADGEWRWVHDEATFLDGAGGEGFWQGFLLDVTERKVAEGQIARALEAEREAAQQLRALDEMKNTFLQAVSHDLRTPLAAILGLAVTLERGDVVLEANDARDLARRIAENARKLDRLVTDLLDMDRLARGIVSPKLESVDVGEVVRRVVAGADLIEPSLLTIDVDRVVIPVDAPKVERIVENLLANTARHTPSNARVWVSVRAQDEGVLIKVEDNGVGVPMDIRETIFEPFQQGPDAPQHSPGVGVGLTLVRRFAELHGGRAWIEDRVGGGASFQVFLPARSSYSATA
jgi:PAS domain S-box-containing protein